MGRNILLARSNIRKAKGQTAAIIVLVLLAAVMMNLWLMLATDYKKNFDRCHDRLNEGHVTMSVYSGDEEFRGFMDNLLKSRSDVTEYCISDAYGWVGTFSYNGGEVNSNLIFLEKNAALSRNVGKIEIVEDGEKDGCTSGVYLPMLYGTAGNYFVGDEIEIALGSEKLKYTVCGFLNSVSMGSHNCGMAAKLLTEGPAAVNTVPKSTLISVRIDDKNNSETAETELNEAITAEYPGINVVNNSYAMVSSSRYISQSICAAILSAMAFLTMLIAAVVIASNVMNYIQEDMKNLGARRA